MSLSNPTLTNPAKHFFQWGGKAGHLVWWNKEEKREVEVKLPFKFIVLDQLATITGYSKSDESGIWANEVRNVGKDELFVRTKKGPLEAGLYQGLSTTIKRGGKYAKSIYIAHKGEGGVWVIGNLKAVGSSLSSWIEYTKRYNAETGVTTMARGEIQEAPTGQFYPPTYTWEKWTDDDYQAALKLDRELQIYLSNYLSAPKVDDDAYGLDTPQDTTKATPEQQADFEARKDATMQPSKPVQQSEVTIEDFADEPINLDDIPF